MPLKRPVVDAYGMSLARNWVVVRAPKFPPTVKDATGTILHLDRSSIHRVTKILSKKSGSPVVETEVKKTVIAMVLAKDGTLSERLVLDSRKTSLTSGLVRYLASAVYVEPGKGNKLKRQKEVSSESVELVVLTDVCSLISALT